MEENLIEKAKEYIVLVNDCSTSMRSNDWLPTRMHAMKKANLKFVEKRASKFPEDQIAIVAFSTTSRIILKLTPAMNRRMIARKIKRLKTVNTTSIGSGLLAAKAALTEVPESATKIIIVNSDGDENTSPKAIPIAIKLKRMGVLIHTIGIASMYGVNSRLLKRIASKRNGEPWYRFIGDAEIAIDHYKDMGENKLVFWGGK